MDSHVTTTPDVAIHCLPARAASSHREDAVVSCSAQEAAVFSCEDILGELLFLSIFQSWDFDGACPLSSQNICKLTSNPLWPLSPSTSFSYDFRVVGNYCLSRSCWVNRCCWDFLLHLCVCFCLFTPLFDPFQSFCGTLNTYPQFTSTVLRMFFITLLYILNSLGHINTHKSNWNIISIYLCQPCWCTCKKKVSFSCSLSKLGRKSVAALTKGNIGIGAFINR